MFRPRGPGYYMIDLDLYYEDADVKSFFGRRRAGMSILYSLFSISLFLYFYDNVNVVISSVLSGALGSPAILVPYPISPLA